MRYSGVPTHDFIGSSEGYRQAGYAVAAEPGFTYSLRRYSLLVTCPVFFVRKSLLIGPPGVTRDLQEPILPRWNLNVQLARSF